LVRPAGPRGRVSGAKGATEYLDAAAQGQEKEEPGARVLRRARFLLGEAARKACGGVDRVAYRISRHLFLGKQIDI
jgi:hypothetical protein